MFLASSELLLNINLILLWRNIYILLWTKNFKICSFFLICMLIADSLLLINTWDRSQRFSIFIDILFVSFCFTDKRQNGWTDQAPHLLWDLTWSQPRESLWMAIAHYYKKLIFVKILKIRKKIVNLPEKKYIIVLSKRKC